MKYEAYRIENGVYDNASHKIDYTRWAAKGQRSTDLNWTTLGIFDTEESAKAFALDDRKANAVHGFCAVYNSNGCGYKDIDPMIR